MPNLIILKDLNLGGISDSPYQGQPNSMAEIVGFNLHSEPGILKNNLLLENATGIITIDDLVKCILPCSDGNTYFFGSTNGKIWQRDNAGVYTYLVTASPASGGVGIFSAYEYQGYIYYAMQSRLGRVVVGTPTAWAGRDDDWATFTNTDNDFHPMQEVNQVLYIGDAFYVSQVDAGVFSDEALDIKTGLRIKSLGKISTDLLIGTYVNPYIASTQILRWNTWAKSYSIADDVPEVGVNSFLKTDNFIIANAGTKGNFYLYNGMQLDNFKRLPGDWTGTNDAQIHDNANCNYFGLPLFGVSNISGNPTKTGIWSLGGYDRNYNKVLNFEFGISTGNISNVEIGAIILIGDTLCVSWKDTTAGTVYGIDELSTTKKQTTAYFTTRAINVARNDMKTMSGNIMYRSLGGNSSIKVYYKVNYDSAWTEAETTVDTIRKVVAVKATFPGATVLEVKVESKAGTGAYLAVAPEIESLELNFD